MDHGHDREVRGDREEDWRLHVSPERTRVRAVRLVDLPDGIAYPLRTLGSDQRRRGGPAGTPVGAKKITKKNNGNDGS